jgi:transcriptional regulator with XRE-family HTH domain
MTIENPPETMLAYVIRKLNDPSYNCSRIAMKLGMRRATLSDIRTGKIEDPAHSTVEKLHTYFKSLAD